MTCEIAIMNRHAIALAADSATTVTQWVEGRPQHRYFKGANKILLEHAPGGSTYSWAWSRSRPPGSWSMLPSAPGHPAAPGRRPVLPRLHAPARSPVRPRLEGLLGDLVERPRRSSLRTPSGPRYPPLLAALAKPERTGERPRGPAPGAAILRHGASCIQRAATGPPASRRPPEPP